MKIQYEKNVGLVELRDIAIGENFEYSGTICIRTTGFEYLNPYDENSTMIGTVPTSKIIAIILRDGCIVSLGEDLLVKKVNAHVVYG